MRLAFLGSPEFAVPSLAALIAAGHEIVCVYAQPPRPAGRGQALRKTPVHAFAEAHGLEARTPRSLRTPEAQAAFAALGLDLAVVVAYGLILPKPILDAPRLGCINLHGSLLPRWRGAAPIQRALMAGDRITGVQVMRMEEGLDTGPVYASVETPIEADDTAGSLHDRMAALGAPLLAHTVTEIEAARARARPQEQEGVTYAHKITPSETRIDWAQSARRVDCQIRGLSPYPGAWFEWNGARIKALDSRVGLGAGAPGEALDDAMLIACGEGAVRLTRVQRAGKGALDAADYLRGAPLPAGARLV
ncbi:MAG: methionyl-tRNA formyltransferase [Hyphomonadaceae bacterium]